MRKKILYITLLLLCIIKPLKADPYERKTILILHSYNNGLQWTDHINESIYSTLNKASDDVFDLRVEYMDTKHYESPEYFKLYRDYLLKKYKNAEIDLIICSDNAAFEFLKKYKNELAPSVPVVFCGLNFFEYIPDNYTGIIEDVDIKANLEVIKRLHPDYDSLYIIVDHSLMGNIIFRHTERAIHKNFPALRHKYLRNYTLGELQDTLTFLNKKDVILLLIFNYDKEGFTVSYDEILDQLRPYSPDVPFYGVWDFYLDKGIIGGNITSGHIHGKEAAEMALSILNGKEVSSIPVKKGTTKFIFDYDQLKKHHIKRKALPEGSIIINIPSQIVKQNPVLFLSIAFFILFLITVIFLLSIMFRRAKRNLIKERSYMETIQSKQTALQKALDESINANKRQKAFFANVSHEIRSPMNGIMGFADLLEAQCPEKTNAKQYLQYIKTNGDHLIKVIDDLLEISKIDAEQEKFKNSRINISELIDDLIETYEPRLKENVTLVKNINSLINSNHIHVTTDEIKLRQVFSNLIENAIKFSDQGKIEVGAFPENDDYLVFFVTDEGIGIEQQHFDIIFQRFAQVEHGYSRTYQGTGLGLSISKSLVELMGGKIWVESESQKGSIFYFSLPAQSGLHTVKN